MLPGTVGVWFEVLATSRVWDEQRDTPRVREAFRVLGLSRGWPAPAHFFDALPPIVTLYQAFPRPEADPKKVQAVFADLAKIFGTGDATH